MIRAFRSCCTRFVLENFLKITWYRQIWVLFLYLHNCTENRLHNEKKTNLNKRSKGATWWLFCTARSGWRGRHMTNSWDSWNQNTNTRDRKWFSTTILVPKKLSKETKSGPVWSLQWKHGEPDQNEHINGVRDKQTKRNHTNFVHYFASRPNFSNTPAPRNPIISQSTPTIFNPH